MSKIVERKSDYSEYKNPENMVEIQNSLLEAKNHGEVKNIIMETFPEWMLGIISNYCSDYPTFQSNWVTVCDKIGVKPTEIIIVDYFDHNNDDYKLLTYFCEIMTTGGYSVRRKEEFIACSKCGDAIPVLEIWRKMKSVGIQTPLSWSKKCTTC